MKLFCFLLFLSFSLFGATSQLIDEDFSYQVDKNWLKLGVSERQSIKKLIYLLRKSSTGTKIIKAAQKKAARKGKVLLDIIVAGETSLCDTTLTRKFYPNSPDKTLYISHSMVYLNKDLVVADAVLDLAHELTHYTYRKPFNPYRYSFTLKEFIQSTVEQKGGEVEAYMVECKVLDELFHRNSSGARDYCNEIRDSGTGRLSKRRAMEQFYKIGSYFERFFGEVANFGIGKKDLPLVSEQLPLFISSAYGVPYPVAAYKEYVNIMERSCENDLKRLAIMKQRTGRSPASAEFNQLYGKMKKGYQRRCLNLFVDRL